MQAVAPASHVDALQRIRTLLGQAGCIDAPELTARFLTDFRSLYRGATPFVACPATTAEVAQVLALCSAARIAVVPQGGNTSYCGGATPSARGDQLVLSLHRLNRIREVDAANFSLIAEAGCVLLNVQAAARSVDRLFPLSLGSEGSCQIGGNLSTNAGGLAAVRYGVTRDLVLGLEVVLADGRVIDGLSSLRKDNTGYDLRDLFIGAEGTLGIITAASLKLFPQPRTIETAFIAVPGMQAAIDLLARLREATGDCVTTFEYLPRIAVEFTVCHIPGVSDPLGAPHPAYVLCEVSTARHDPHLRGLLEDALAAAMDHGAVIEATFAESLAQREALWRLRESVPEAQRHEGASIKHDVSVPVAALPAFLHKASTAVAQVAPCARLVAYGHVGDGNLHFNLSEPAGGGDRTAFLALQEDLGHAVHACVQEFRGSISAEHGIGQLKRELLARHKDPVALAAMRSIKQALDPRGILNPGKVLPD
ncbi:MAG: FAD-binding oxidoreductase [Steroidobacteraceae bacterium]|jgi:FAD/FMN-containing dehydrogenase|nr:FAD-binding oxidoreductase [Pseudomonadota bacterium]MBP7610679.1 FAD-binding oxidoreductase [Steroidobacteraceae bacterium]MBP9129776.1 FAD-binding oxidoreductase [Steroidobacteraceae bacterium]